MTACESCGDTVDNGAARYCSNACRQRAYRQRSRCAPTESANDLPHPLDGFIGREDELTGITRLLRHSRLITLLGPAGAGKTRIAAELAGRVRRRFAHGVRFVDLGELNRPELVGQAVASAIGASEEPGRQLVDGLVSELRDKDLLLVLDNCEHLVEACGELVVRLLRRCGGLRVLATSREMLRLPGEMIFPIGELPAADAVQLFVERAKAVAPGFDATDDETVGLICTRLDRMPLAVELAAKLVRVLPLKDIVDGLDDRFAMLASTTRGIDARHRDLLAAIEWSYELLDPAEQAVFRALSVLPGGFGFDLAAAVGGATVPLMSTLESKSVIAPIPDRPGRFRQLETVRYFARRKLDESGERPAAIERLVDWLTTLATPLIETFATSGDALERLTVELQNLLAGLDFLSDTDDERQLLLVSALVRCRQRLGIAADGCERLATALRVPGGVPAYRAYALEQASWLAAWYDDEQAALGLAQQAVELGPSHGSTPLHSRALQALAFARQVCGDHHAARESFAECLRHVRALGEPLCVALCLNNLAWSQLLVGDLGGAQESITEAGPLYRAHAEPARQAALLHTTGVLALLRDEPATEHFTESLRLLENSSSMIQPYALEGLAVSALRVGDYDRGLRLMGFASSVRTGAGDPWWRDLVVDALRDAMDRLPERRADGLLADGRDVPVDQGLRYALGGDWPTGNRETTDCALTGRQLGVAALLVEGLTNRQIAGRLRISERTVETHLDHIRTKLDLRSRAQVAAWAATHTP
ncbi:LuxR family transcriptional regulator [Lentzea tibetensis]|uniref:LuxR family transcriptional regulator n=1 Tax=Lentzea tibetensis TaxID=2591470 RepID=A0A563EST0_9PSEU|nr:LuxR C-terminal-related transcriptional regulator [Lentzea tibetensis]TWP50662.1 LuxR family transcriptional regulator [Lentzea tibetensis]